MTVKLRRSCIFSGRLHFRFPISPKEPEKKLLSKSESPFIKEPVQSYIALNGFFLFSFFQSALACSQTMRTNSRTCGSSISFFL